MTEQDQRQDELRSRDEVRNDPTISPAVLKAMERFWAKLDAIKAQAKHYPDRFKS